MQKPRIASYFQDEEFLAEEYLVTIQPNFSTGEALRLVSTEHGPFDRRTCLTVPLWMAVELEQHGKCSITPPGWLRADVLKGKIKEEREKGPSMFASVDQVMFEVGTILLNRDYLGVDYLGGPIERANISSLLTEILLIRKAKAIEGLKQIDITSSVIDISRMVSIERACIRPQASRLIDELRELWTIRQSVLGAEPRGM